MIASLRGTLASKAADHLVVDVAGVGYQVSVPLSTFFHIPEPGGEVSLLIHTHLREDSLSLFGFLTRAEKDAFALLIGVSGIGPKLALAVLSALPVHELAAAIASGEETRLCAVPGIGKKTAGRLVLELKDRMKQLGERSAPAGAGAGDAAGDMEDAVLGLVGLGYKRSQAEEALRKVRQRGADRGIESLIREALGELTGR